MTSAMQLGLFAAAAAFVTWRTRQATQGDMGATSGDVAPPWE